MKTRGLVTTLLATLFASISLFGYISKAPASPLQSSSPMKHPAKIQSAAKTVDAWAINQTTKMFGELVLIVSKAGIKSTFTRSSMCLVMTPPFDTVTVYNKNNQTIYQTSVRTFHCPAAKTFALFNAWVLGESPMIKVGKGKIQGFNVIKYQTTKAFTAKQAALRRTDKVPSSNPMIIDCQSTDDFGLPPGAGLGLDKLYGIPEVPGIPLAVDLRDLGMTKRMFLQSEKCTKIKVNTAEFAIPVGYRTLKSIEEINQSNVNQDAMQLFGK